ncbi:MAG: site-specific DNA-methyltransferase [Glaciimonas sp.]|nr:site-specific DNA-methyltransferase [Glaciimonas sp.]
MSLAFETPLGKCFNGMSEKILTSNLVNDQRGNVNLIFTSPPFPLNRKKKYGNEQGQEYIDWLVSFAPIFRSMLAENGSIVMEVGNSWEPGRPVMSTLALKALLAFLEEGKFSLCQQFIWNNSAKLPSPAQWVNIERIRLKDSFTYLWWMAPTDRPKANNRNVLDEYSASMKKLQSKKRYNPGLRPSEHNISPESFFVDNGGSIPSSVITASNTKSNGPYLDYCKVNNLMPHPARMPEKLPSTFIKFLTDENDLVLDPFGGSNTTGAIAEELNRRWMSVEPNMDYINASKGRFLPKEEQEALRILAGTPVASDTPDMPATTEVRTLFSN